LRNLSFASGALDRAGHRRKDPALLTSLLNDPATRVVEVVAGRAKVIDSDGDPLLLLRSPGEQDGFRLAAFLGRDDGGTAYLGVVGDTQDVSPISQWRTLREVGGLPGQLARHARPLPPMWFTH